MVFRNSLTNKLIELWCGLRKMTLVSSKCSKTASKCNFLKFNEKIFFLFLTNKYSPEPQKLPIYEIPRLDDALSCVSLLC